MSAIDLGTLLALPVVQELRPAPVPMGIPVGCRIMFGETYDGLGHVFESLKYYAYVSLLSAALAEHQGLSATMGEIVVADTAVTRNYPQQASEWLERGQTHRAAAERMFELLGLKLRVVLMSEFISSPDFIRRCAEVRQFIASSDAAMTLVEQTVPIERRDEERRRGWTYAIEEIATILPYGLKVGPPRERFYDDPARLVAKSVGHWPLVSVFLTPTLPLGLPLSKFISDRDLVINGVTPYKAGSRGLKGQRVLLREGAVSTLGTLVAATPIVQRPGVPSPLGEFADTVELVAVACGAPLPDEWPSTAFRGSMDADEARRHTVERFREVVARPLGIDQ